MLGIPVIIVISKHVWLNSANYIVYMHIKFDV